MWASSKRPRVTPNPSGADSPVLEPHVSERPTRALQRRAGDGNTPLVLGASMVDYLLPGINKGGEGERSVS